MKVFLTGHRGYIGSVMTPMLLQAGHDVVGCDSDLYERCTFDAGGKIVDVPSIIKDTREIEKADLKGVDAVIHLAALSNDPLGNLNPDLTHAINHRASVRLAKLAKDAGVGRFLMASSCSNYGQAGDDLVDETAELSPVTAYGESKVWSERGIAPLADDSFCPSFEKIARALPAFKPQWNARKGAEQCYEAYRSSGLTLEEFEGPRYQRISHIKKLIADGILDNELRHVKRAAA
jgi:hypothetical protein